ncbi:VRR-NUC domain-containing protein [Mycena galericulata]|nr:VRR-NUC domain-containing protein [Mycena galericulata]
MSGRPRKIIRDLIFGGGEDTLDEDEIDESEQTRETDSEQTTVQAKTWTRSSLYVEVLERALRDINKHEGERNLFTEEEREFLVAIAGLEYHSRFVLIRLILRKPGKWHSIDSLRKYIGEVGEHGLKAAFAELCKRLRPEIIDLTGDSDDEDAAQPVAGPSNIGAKDTQVRLDYFCQGQEDISIPEALQILHLDQIRDLCKTMKIKHTGLKKDGMVTALINHASTQSILAFGNASKSKGKDKGKSRDTGLRQSTLPWAVAKIKGDLTERLRDLTLKSAGKSIRVHEQLHALMVRLHIIWLRETQRPESLFSSALLAGFKKRVYAEYEHVRDPDIWRTREQYLEYETGIHVEAVIDEILKPEPKSQGATKLLPASSFIPPGTPGLDFIRNLTNSVDEPDDAVEETPAHYKARLVKEILEVHVLPKWTALVSAGSIAAAMRKPGLERFEPGYVYTRMIRKCSSALATLKEFVFEKDLLERLLAQRIWRRGSRGGWYERRALLQMNYLIKNADGTKDMNVLWKARDGLIEALQDEDTATVTRPGLIKRLDRVETLLKMTDAEKAKHDDVALKTAEEVFIEAVRVYDHPDSVKLDAHGKVKGKENKTADGPVQMLQRCRRKRTPWRWTGKSLWQGKDGTCNVETRALQYYEEHGFKGFHSETQILTTLFGLLFWDIIFAPVPGAFETPWQMGPLDIGDDSFYYARRDRIEKRLADIKDGQARAILEANDERHRENQTCCIGVSWKMCGREELVEIVECLGGEALSSICRLFCEDYGGRNSGVPDLIVWNIAKKECKFVEVKGPGDHLQENQKLWSDALLTAQCSVEVCHVLDRNRKKKTVVKKTPKPRGRPKASTSRAKTRVRTSLVEPESDTERGSQIPIVVDSDRDEAWEPSTVIREPPPRESKRHRRSAVDDDDELPVFTPTLDPQSSSSHSPPANIRKRRAEVLSTPPPKRSKTI